MTLENLDRETREALNLDEDFQGVVITHVERYSPSSERGLRRGDVIVEITQVEVSTVEEARKRIEELRAMGRKSILLKVYRRGSYSHVAVSFDEEEEQ